MLASGISLHITSPPLSPSSIRPVLFCLSCSSLPAPLVQLPSQHGCVLQYAGKWWGRQCWGCWNVDMFFLSLRVIRLVTTLLLLRRFFITSIQLDAFLHHSSISGAWYGICLICGKELSGEPTMLFHFGRLHCSLL